MAAGLLAHSGHVVPSVALSTVAVRWAVLLLAACIAGFLLRTSRPSAAVALAVLSGVLATSAPTWTAALLAVTHRAAAALWLGAVGSLVWGSARPRFASAGDDTPPSRTRPGSHTSRVAVGAAAMAGASGLALARLDRVALDGVAFDRLVQLKGLAFLAACALGLVLHRRGTGPRASLDTWRRLPALELVALGVAASVGSGLAVVPAAPPAGRPVVTAAAGLPLVVVPQRPGANYVHVDSTEPVVVNGTRSTTLPGTAGQWVRLQLPPGRSRLHVTTAGRPAGTALVDTGHATGPVPDGPECASSQLAAALARTTEPACPSQLLTDADATALVALRSWLSRRGVRDLVVRGDATVRSRKAAALLRTGATGGPQAGPTAVVLTGAWDAAAAQLQQIGRHAPGGGVYLAPWLLDAPLLSGFSTAAPLVVLPFDPHGSAARRYVSALPPGETPTAAGYCAFGGSVGRVQVFATSPASILPKDLGHEHTVSRGWFPGGTLTPVSGYLPLRAVTVDSLERAPGPFTLLATTW